VTFDLAVVTSGLPVVVTFDLVVVTFLSAVFVASVEICLVS